MLALSPSDERSMGRCFYTGKTAGCVYVDLGERFPRPRSEHRGSLRPHARRVAVLGMGAGGSRPLPLRGPGVSPGKFFVIFDAKSRIWGQFGPDNKLIEGQLNEYDVICRNASVLAVPTPKY